MAYTLSGNVERTPVILCRTVRLSGIRVAMCFAMVVFTFQLSATEVQVDANMRRYSINCSINEERSSMDCEAEVWVRLLRDSLSSVTWSVPMGCTIISVQNGFAPEAWRVNGTSVRGTGFYDINCPIPVYLCVNDSVLFRFKYTVSADTSAVANIFIARREFILRSGAHFGWVPLLYSPSESTERHHVPVMLEVRLSSQFTLLSGGTIDSLTSRDGSTSWKITRSDVAGWEDSFCLAGSKDVHKSAVQVSAGMCGVSLFTSSSQFQEKFADSLARMLGFASRYFAAHGCRARYDRLTFACVGKASVGAKPVRSGNLVLLGGAPEYGVFDSSVFLSGTNNFWLHETARVYAFDTPDSSYWFNESWAGYLSTRFLFAWSDTTERLQFIERSQLLARTLDFFPTYPIAAGRTSRVNEDAVFLYKGRYVFMMLESILGTGTFDGVMREMYARSHLVPPGITALQSLCESAYGSSLSWFFDQWLLRTGFPEYILSSQTEPTSRGTYAVSATVTQRGDIFIMPLTLRVETTGKAFVKKIFLKEEILRFSYVVSSMPKSVECDPQYLVLRWVPQYRILAHARTSVSHRVVARDMASSEREALLTLQLDPDNNVGANSIALFSLGNVAGARQDWPKAEEYFLRASEQREPDGYAFYPLLSVVRRGNMLDLRGSRDTAIVEYRRALDAATKNPLVYGRVIVEAARFIQHPFTRNDTVWYEYY